MIGAPYSSKSMKIWIATTPVDMRRSFDRLAEHVRSYLGHDPLSGDMFVFRNRTGRMLKILLWDQNGLAIYYKRIELGRFKFPHCTSTSMTIDRDQLIELLSGCSIRNVRRA